MHPKHATPLSAMLPLWQDPHKTPVPADDVDAAQWFAVSQLRGLKGAFMRGFSACSAILLICLPVPGHLWPSCRTPCTCLHGCLLLLEPATCAAAAA